MLACPRRLKTKSCGLGFPKRTNNLQGLEQNPPLQKAAFRGQCPSKVLFALGQGWDWLGHVRHCMIPARFLLPTPKCKARLYHYSSGRGVPFKAACLRPNVQEIEGQVKRMVREFWDANTQEQQRSMRRPPVRWSPPPAGTYKANFDAAIFEELQCVGLGVVFRDHSGQVIAALSQRIGLSRTVELAEALAARRAVEFAKELSLFDIILEGDCLRVVQALSASGGCNTLYGHVVNETKRLGAGLRHCSYQHVCREGNKLAHGLARRAVSSADIDVWVEDLPEDLDVVFQSDLS
ncbi:hypothetical protein SO802_009718 [Lithocarpus litseifolius]|uniref:RNase H type-1 domain-containing protein n=1 Tax=Lithocarpus litseifolius TaxID=425828 RepID=A0AAW2DCU5_9ROSI